jgi:hypothetical protein
MYVVSFLILIYFKHDGVLNYWQGEGNLVGLGWPSRGRFQLTRDESMDRSGLPLV